MQRSILTEEKQKNELAQTDFRFMKTIIIIRGGNYASSFASISELHCSKRRQTSRWPPRVEKCSGVYCLKESKRINLRKKSFASLKKNNKGRQLRVVFRLYISIALQQKTANFKVAIPCRVMQCSPLPEEKQKNQFTA
jgi:hypothetical protein